MTPPKQAPKGLGDYVEVADRIHMFYDQYPDGRLVTYAFEVRDIGERTWIIVQAHAYRTSDDPHPGVGTAWEAYPGKTPFTRDSELMNAETSAWGRALAAVGIAVKQGIASREDVANRRADSESGPTGGNGNRTVTAAQIENIMDLIQLSDVAPQKLQGWIVAINPDADIKLTKGWSKRAVSALSPDQAEELTTRIEAHIKELAVALGGPNDEVKVGGSE